MPKFPPALPHGSLEEVFDDIFFVPGTIGFKFGVYTAFSRNMTVVRENGALTLINTMRLNEDGLTRLDSLGKVEHVIRIAGFHGMDDAFYKDRYGAKVWAVRGHVYAKGFNATKVKPEDGYFHPDVYMDEDTELPISNAKLKIFDGVVNEGLLNLEREGGILVSGDSMQNWAKPDEFFNFAGRVSMRLMGFLKPCNIGPGWYKQAKPKREDVKSILDLEFDHLLPAHGFKVIGGAKEKYRPAIDRL